MCRGTLAEAPLTGGAPHEVRERVEFADWAPDRKQLAIGTFENSQPRKRRLEFPMGKVLFEAGGSGWPGDPKVSPGGDMVAFANHDAYGDDGSVAVVDLNGRKRTLTQKFTSLQGLAWSPNGKEIWFTGAPSGAIRQLYAVNLFGAMRAVGSAPGNLKLQDIAVDGRLLLTRDDMHSSVYVQGPGESAARDLTWLDFALYPLLSPDGKKLAMTENGEGVAGGTSVFVRGTDGSPAVHVGDGMDGDSLSPDGKWVAGVTAGDVQPRVVLLPMGAGQPVPIDRGSLRILFAPAVRWFPDSQKIVFRALEAGHKARSFVQGIHGGPPRPVTPEGLSGVWVTPDGASLLVFDSESRAFLYPVEGGTPKPLPFLTVEYTPIVFAADGRSLFVWKKTEQTPKVWRVDLATGRVDVWREIPVPDRTGLQQNLVQSVQITPDGKYLAWRVGRTLSELYLVEGLR
jgi:Tol biopolymer transport system component